MSTLVRFQPPPASSAKPLQRQRAAVVDLRRRDLLVVPALREIAAELEAALPNSRDLSAAIEVAVKIYGRDLRLRFGVTGADAAGLVRAARAGIRGEVNRIRSKRSKEDARGT
ncbi:hypothetical protein EB235_19775 [Mesorhizobium loti R88b]|uniref:Uncharacterized protein n=1 Tax=Mesorhizobium loti R88b TaxID=935548 RepID=A0A6M7WNA9_RHILI|nr:hypothetical protein EB235_19775 [Mesorhizobium loti R88b]